MQKKIIAVALAILALSFFAVACGKDDKFEEDETYAPVEFTTDTEGNQYVQNVDGDLIPVTTSKDGGMELIEDLRTKPKEQADKEAESIKNEATAPTEEQTNAPDTGNETTSKAQTGIVVDKTAPNEDHDAVIHW